jgi:hypothetical protein
VFGIVRGGVQFGPLGTTATNRPIVLAPGDYDDGEIGGIMIGKVNLSTRKKKPVPVPLCPPQTPHACPDANPARRRGKPATSRLNLRHGLCCSSVQHLLSPHLLSKILIEYCNVARFCMGVELGFSH